MTYDISAYSQLEKIFSTYYWLKRNLSILNWDSAVMMPVQALHVRSEQISVQVRVMHRVLTEPRVAKLIAKSKSSLHHLNPWQQANLREMDRLQILQAAVPRKLQARLCAQAVATEIVWREAKYQKNFQLFEKPFTKLIHLLKLKADYLSKAFQIDPYSGLMQEYDAGGSQQKIEPLFDELSIKLPQIIPQIIEQQSQTPPPSALPLLSIPQQKKLCHEVLKDLGFDFSRGRLDESSHPFTEGGIFDARITTTYVKENFLQTLLAAIHECGHALYDQNLPMEWFTQPAGYERSMRCHEGIALFYEMGIVRNRYFASYLTKQLEKLHIHYPEEDLLKHIMKVERTSIRIEADEVTYLLHIILRYEIEKKLFANNLKVNEIPEYWHSRMKSLIGIDIPTSAMDCLQDIHWALGLFGYFPSYAQGLLIASQLHKFYEKHIERQDFASILTSLKKNFFSYGSFYPEIPLVNEFFNKEATCSHFLTYLNSRYLLKTASAQR